MDRSRAKAEFGEARRRIEMHEPLRESKPGQCGLRSLAGHAIRPEFAEPGERQPHPVWDPPTRRRHARQVTQPLHEIQQGEILVARR